MDKRLAKRAPQALHRLESAGIHIILSGHLHRWAVDALIETGRHPRLLQVQNGTALCARVSDLRNEFAVLDIEGPEVTVQRHFAEQPLGLWAEPEIARYSRASGIWRRV